MGKHFEELLTNLQIIIRITIQHILTPRPTHFGTTAQITREFGEVVLGPIPDDIDP